MQKKDLVKEMTMLGNERVCSGVCYVMMQWVVVVVDSVVDRGSIPRCNNNQEQTTFQKVLGTKK